jgi:GNAT superfamily N-acetyltransferase
MIPENYIDSLDEYLRVVAYNIVSDEVFIVAEKIPNGQNVDDTTGVEIGIGVIKKGQGLGSKLTAALVDWFYSQDTYDVLWWPVDEANDASIRVAEENGFFRDPMGKNWVLPKGDAYEKLGLEEYQEIGDEDMKRYVRSSRAIEAKISENDYSQSQKGIAYKVFRIKNGKLYPPMVANPGGADTPVGVWLDAEEGEFAGLSKTGRPQVKQAKGGQTLAYRPGWHLGDVPRAKQFDRSFSWEIVEDVSPTENAELINGNVKTYNAFINNYAKTANVGKVFYVEDLGVCLQVVDDNAPYFPYDFVWAECEYLMDIDYQAEADEQGYMRTNPDGSTYRSDKYQHSLAGLPKLPKNGYYKYRTNPNPDTVPWVITGAIKVNKLLDDFDVQAILGGNAPERQGGDKTLEQLGLTQI